MAENLLHPDLKSLTDALDSLGRKVMNGWTNDATLQDNWGWPHVPMNRYTLARAANGLASAIRARGTDNLEPDAVVIVKADVVLVQKLENNTVQNLYNGQGNPAALIYLATLGQIRDDLEPILGWHAVKDVNMLPPKLARRLRSYQARLDEIAPNTDELTRRINLINDATEAAESLPTDLAELTAARTKIQNVQTDVLLASGKIAEKLKEADEATKAARAFEQQASKLVAKCEEAYQITTTKGLAAAFDEKTQSLSNSMWAWVAILLLALGVGYFLGKERLTELSQLLTVAQQQKVPVWPEVFLAIVSLGGPIWLAWIATKQIGQRFRLAEDYAYKASVSKAYEGYKKAAAGIDEELEVRLFAAAITRLEEAPLRLVEQETHGSPWHEFMDSDAFHKALEIVPGFRDQVKRLGKRIGGKAANGDAQAEVEEKTRN